MGRGGGVSAAWFGLGFVAGFLLMYGVFLALSVHVHRWSKWQLTTISEQWRNAPSMDVAGQTRSCLRCGKTQLRKVRP